MGYLPIFLDVTGRRCLFVGGGEVAARKVASLLEADADVVVVSPSLTADLRALAGQGRIRHIDREYIAGDLAGVALVYDASDNAELHQRLHSEANQLGIPINVVDVPALCTFIAPAVMTRGSLQIAVSTHGASPAMAKRIVQRLEGLFGPEYGAALEVLRAARRYLLANEPNVVTRAQKLTALAAAGIPEHLKNGDVGAVDEIVRRVIGVHVELSLGSIATRRAASSAEAPDDRWSNK